MAQAIPATSRSTAAPPRQWLALGGFLLLAQLAGLIGIPFTDRDPGGWYDQLDKPWFNPPSWVFGPVWTMLYVFIGIAAWLVWRTPPARARTTALALWAVQLVLNALWTPIFFGAERPGWALVEIALLLVAVVVTTVRFATIERVAGILFVPYVAWASFATLLNASIVVLN